MKGHPASKFGTLARWALLACLIGGGALWALSPVGVELSALKFKTPDVFWRLFPSAPLLLSLGLVGLLLTSGGARRGPLAKVGLWVTIVGTALVLAGAVGLFHLGVDDAFIMTAPAYRAFRAGLILLAAGGLIFAFAESRDGRLPAWIGLPLAVSALAGLVAVTQDLGPFGAALWSVFGAGWVWLGLGLFMTTPHQPGHGEALPRAARLPCQVPRGDHRRGD